MAEQDDRERTESPTPKRLEQARERGQVPRSRDLNAAAVVLAGALGICGFGLGVGGQLLGLMRASLTLTPTQMRGAGYLLPQLAHVALQGAQAAAPLLGLIVAAAVLAPLSIGGWNFSAQALVPDWSRLSPANGLARMLSGRGAVELLKALARFIVIALIAVIVLWKQFDVFATLAREPMRAGVGHSLSLVGTALIALGGGLGLIALIDVPLALWQHQRSLRMTRQEIRDEAKETEGHPEQRARVRRVQQKMARQRMMQEIKRADVVITNPTHYAVALRYDEKRMRAPILVAKGAELVAQRIREIATEHRVPIVAAPPLARALHSHCELGDEIPARLYAAVAQVLTYVYQLRSVRRHGGRTPETPRIVLPDH